MQIRQILVFGCFFIFASTVGQGKLDGFLKPSDTLDIKRRNTVIISEAAFSSVVLVGLNQIWYADYPRSNFHWINDNSEWLQMDKAGHVLSCYHLGSFGQQTLAWSGVSEKKQLIYGATLGLGFMSVVEVMDGYSSNWGASLGDVAANVTGTALFVSQQLAWNEQRIVPKFSFHQTQYASQRAEVLGKSLNEQILKDYNGQTYWLSANVHSFFKKSKIPQWFNVALGYGAEGMITGNDQLDDEISVSDVERYRQFYLSFDADLTKIKTKSHVLKTIFALFNTIKIPAPTFEINGRGDLKFHYLYF